MKAIIKIDGLCLGANCYTFHLSYDSIIVICHDNHTGNILEFIHLTVWQTNVLLPARLNRDMILSLQSQYSSTGGHIHCPDEAFKISVLANVMKAAKANQTITKSCYRLSALKVIIVDAFIVWLFQYCAGTTEAGRKIRRDKAETSAVFSGVFVNFLEIFMSVQLPVTAQMHHF